jgi:APA family basic amino acid/polyamine antiporter
MSTEPKLVRGLGLMDSTMIVAGSMIGSGIFLVSADMARQVGAPGWLLVAWLITGLLTITAALSYGELATMMPKAGGQYIYLREALSPLWGFLYGWTFFAVIQAGTIAAVAIGFARYLGVLVPGISESSYIVAPIHLGGAYAVSLSVVQLVALVVIVVLTWISMYGLHWGKLVQNVFTFAKIGALVALILIGVALGWGTDAMQANFSDLWTVRGSLQEVGPAITALAAPAGLFIAMCVSQTNSLFAADAWNMITFTAGEVKEPRRNVPLSLAFGVILVIGLYLLVNVAYLATLRIEDMQTVSSDLVAAATAEVAAPGYGGVIMAIVILVATFGCNNGLILGGARAYYAMAKDGLFFRAAGRLNRHSAPGWGLAFQGIWSAVFVFPRTVKTGADGSVSYGNLYNDLLTYTMSATIIFYILTIAGVFVLRRRWPDVPRPYRAWGYPWVPGSYIVLGSVILAVLFIYQPAITLPGLVIILTGVPVYYYWRAAARRDGIRFENAMEE